MDRVAMMTDGYVDALAELVSTGVEEARRAAGGA
jgi:hypothetical protein